MKHIHKHGIYATHKPENICFPGSTKIRAQKETNKTNEIGPQTTKSGKKKGPTQKE